MEVSKFKYIRQKIRGHRTISIYLSIYLCPCLSVCLSLFLSSYILEKYILVRKHNMKSEHTHTHTHTHTYIYIYIYIYIYWVVQKLVEFSWNRFVANTIVIGETYLEALMKKLFHSYKNSLIHTTFISYKSGLLHIIQEQSESIFPEKWIGRRGPIDWPARSPDLTPMDFFLSGNTQEQSLSSKIEKYW